MFNRTELSYEAKLEFLNIRDQVIDQNISTRNAKQETLDTTHGRVDTFEKVQMCASTRAPHVRSTKRLKMIGLECPVT